MMLLLLRVGGQDFILNAKTQGLPDGHSDLPGGSKIIHTCDTGSKHYKKIINSSLNRMKHRHHEQRRNRKIWVEPWDKRHGTQGCAACRDYCYIKEPPAFTIQGHVADHFHHNKDTPAKKRHSDKAFFPSLDIDLKGRELGKFGNGTDTDHDNNQREYQEEYQMV
ncbi:MAG: hypothetical protein ACYC2W_01685 [Desulfurivibrionaceae bacterium]